jgi:hypothetical protein
MADIWSNLLAPLTGKPIEEAAAAKAAAIAKGKAELEGSYAAGRGDLTNYYTQALQPYMELKDPAMGGYNAYADASGARGLEGQIRAQQAFTTDPGYQFARDEALDAANRTGIASGVAVGNRTADAMSRASGLASKQYGDYVSRLLPWLGQGAGIAGGLSNIYTGLGGELNRSFQGQGQAQYGANVGIGDAQAQGLMAPMIAGSNIWSGIGQAAKLATSLATGMPGGGGGGGGMAGPQYAGIAGNQYAGPVNPLLV